MTFVSTAAGAACLICVPSAYAQDEVAQVSMPGDIVVTARKREEDILKTPVTVVAITGEQLDTKGVKTMQDLAGSTPGININDSSTGHADRSFQQIILRGMTPSKALATKTSLFIDGVPIASPSAFTAISAPERIEILKGPQSAYFGRNTFAGAFNVVNAVPTGDWRATITGMAGTRSNYRGRVEVEGPIIGDALNFRATAEKFGKDGSWRNEFDGRTLGDQSTQTATLLITAQPTDRLKVKVFGMLARDEDGPSAQTRILAQNITGLKGKVVYASQANCIVNGNPFLCGTLPRFANGVSANTEITPNLRNILAQTNNRVISPKDTIDHYGLLRNTRHVHGTIDYELKDQLSLSVLGGGNREKWMTLLDLDGFDTSMLTSAFSPGGYFDFPYVIERDNKAYISATDNWTIEPGYRYLSTYFAVLVGLPELRTGGGLSSRSSIES